MNSMKFISGFLLLLGLTFVAACGGNSSNNNNIGDVNTVTTSPAGTYSVTYIAGTGTAAPSEGKTTFQVKVVQRSDNTAASGLANYITLNPMMSGMNMDHSAPVDVISESATAGTYNCTIYYLMGGDWQLDVKIGSETATFYPSVASAAPGSDTTKKSMYGSDDIVTSVSGTSTNKYYILRDGMVSSGTSTLGLYIAHSERMMKYFAPVSVGSLLSVSTGTQAVSAMTVKASTDNSTYVDAVDGGNGHWSVPGLTLASGVTSTVYVKLNVSTPNAQDKTTNGLAPSGSNAYATFSVTPDM